jgi:hypothetical protein
MSSVSRKSKAAPAAAPDVNVPASSANTNNNEDVDLFASRAGHSSDGIRHSTPKSVNEGVQPTTRAAANNYTGDAAASSVGPMNSEPSYNEVMQRSRLVHPLYASPNCSRVRGRATVFDFGSSCIMFVGSIKF